MRRSHSPGMAERGTLRSRLNSTAGLGNGQVFVLIFGFLLASALIFVFGFWLGRDYEVRRLEQEERIVRLPAPAPPTVSAEAKEREVDSAFYQRLNEKAYQRMQETKAVGAPTPTGLIEVTTPTATAARVVARPTPPRPTAVPRAKSPEVPPRGDDWADAGWTVQVNATTNPSQATELARKLKAKGYDAYTVQAPMR